MKQPEKTWAECTDEDAQLVLDLLYRELGVRLASAVAASRAAEMYDSEDPGLAGLAFADDLGQHETFAIAALKCAIRELRKSRNGTAS